MALNALTALMNEQPEATSSYPDLGAADESAGDAGADLYRGEVVWTAPELRRPGRQAQQGPGPGVRATAPFATPAPSRSATPELNECAKCADAVETLGRAFVDLACGHKMHIRCFIDTIGGSTANTSALDDSKMGGVHFCVHCVRMIHDGSANCDTQIDASQLIKALISNFERETGKRYYPRHELNSQEPTEQLINVVLGRGNRDMLMRQHDDYDKFMYASEKTLVGELKQRRRDFTAIFDSGQQRAITLQDIYVFGIRTYESLCALGFSPSIHLSQGWRKICPLWMLHEMYNVSVENLFEQCTARDLLLTLTRPEDFWLAGATVEKLIDNNISINDLLRYPARPSLMVKYLGLNAACLRRLGMRKEHVKKSKHWARDAKNKLVAPLLKDLP